MAETDLERLDSLRKQGILSEEAYWDARSRLYSPPPTTTQSEPLWVDQTPPAPPPPPPPSPPTPPPTTAPRPRPAPGPRFTSVPVAAADPADDRAGPRRRRRPLLYGLAGLVAVAAITVAVLTLVIFTGPSTVTVTGALTLTDDATASASCQGQGEDSAIKTGAGVVLSVPGHKAQKAVLGAGQVTNGACVYPFTFKSVSTTADTYRVKVAGVPLKAFARADLKAASWKANLSFGPPTTVVNGTLELDDAESAADNCVTSLGYDDIREGASVTIKDQNGRILGSGSLDAGVSYDDASCTFDFTVADIREDQQQYSVEISHRGQITNSRSEMESNNWRFDLTLGD